MIKGFEEQIEEVKGHLAQITRYTIRYLKELKKNYGKDRERKTELSMDDDGNLIVEKDFTTNVGLVTGDTSPYD